MHSWLAWSARAQASQSVAQTYIYIPSTVNNTLMLWHTKWVSCVLAYFDPNGRLFSQNWQFSQFNVNQLFSADVIYRNSNFALFLLMKTWNKPSSKVGYFSKIAENFSTAQTAKSAQRHQQYNLKLSVYSTWNTYITLSVAQAKLSVP